MEKLPVKKLIEKMNFLKGERATWESHWQEIADYMHPRKNTIVSDLTPGQKRNINVLDNTGMYSLELLAGQLHGLLTNPTGIWFGLTTGVLGIDQQDDVRVWLQKTAKDIHNVLNNSNFQTEVHELYLDECSFGTAAMYMEEDEKDVIRFSTKFIGEYYIDEDSKGRVNQIYRKWKWNAYQIVEKFGIENVGPKVQKAFEKNSEEIFQVAHAVYPVSMITAKPKTKMTYVSHYFLCDYAHDLEVGGYMEFPYVAPRWSKGTGEKYGRSPAMTALPEVKTINKMSETMIIAAQKVIDPPIQMPDEGFVMPIYTKPGGVNFYRAGSNDRITPVFNDVRIDFGFEAMKEKRLRIREAFFIDQLMLQQGPQMTATEVLQRTEEKMRLLGPMLGRQQAEFLSPLIDRTFNIMLRRGLIDTAQIPEALQGRKVDVKYSSMIAKSQNITEAQSVMRLLDASMPFINLDNSVADNFDGDKAVVILGDVFQVPQAIIKTRKEVQQIRQARAEAQQAAIDAQNQQQEVEQVSKLAPVMAQAQQ